MKTAGCFLLLLVSFAAVLHAGAADEPLDSNKVRQIRKKEQSGGKLTPEEEAYYERAKAARKKGEAVGEKRPDAPPAGKIATSARPLTDMTAEDHYKGEDGGLYGGGRNAPPAAHLKAALAEAAKIQPLNEKGEPSDEGRVVLMSMGMSNTTLEFQEFVKTAMTDAQRWRKLIALDGSRSGETAADWARPREQDRKGTGAWATAMERLKTNGLSPLQVQVVWAKMAEKEPAKLGEFPAHARRLQQDTQEALRLLKQYCPNARIVYLSSRTYGGYTHGPLNPEPYAYESAFAMRWLIQDQLRGGPAMSYQDGKFPLLLWGPYLWADGPTPRADGFAWQRDDYKNGGIHVTDNGAKKVTEQLLTFFKTDPTAKVWFVNP